MLVSPNPVLTRKSLYCKNLKRLPTKRVSGNGQLLIGLLHRFAHQEIVNPGLLESLLAQESRELRQSIWTRAGRVGHLFSQQSSYEQAIPVRTM